MPSPESIRLYLLIASLVGLLGIVKRPFYGLLSYTIIMITRPGLFFPAIGALRIELLVGVIIIFIIVLSQQRLSRLNPSTSPICKWVFALTVVILLSYAQAFDLDYSWTTVQNFMKVFFFFIMIVTLIDNTKDIKLFVAVFMLSTFAISYNVLYNSMYGLLEGGTGGFRIEYAVADKGMGAGHVAVANITLQAMPFLWYAASSVKRPIIKTFLIICFLLSTYTVFLAGSRGGIVGLVTLILVLTLFTKHRALMFGISLTLFIILMQSMGSSYKSYMSTILKFGRGDVSSRSRIVGLRHGFEMLVKRPILGVGPGVYRVARRAWFNWGLLSHNLYGQLMGELGLIGTTAWFIFLYSYLKMAWDLRKLYIANSVEVNILTAVVAATAVRLVLGMGSHSLYIFFWYMAAAIVVALNRIHSDIATSSTPSFQSRVLARSSLP